MSKKKKQGRPRTFKPAQRRELAELVRLHGARGAKQFAPVRVSVGTLLRIAHEFGVELKRGKRPSKPT